MVELHVALCLHNIKKSLALMQWYITVHNSNSCSTLEDFKIFKSWTIKFNTDDNERLPYLHNIKTISITANKHGTAVGQWERC
jgi:hypothetical protein